MSLANHPNVLGRTAAGASSGGATGNAAWTVTITSLTELAAIPTTGITPPMIRAWRQTSDATAQFWELLAGTDATDPGSVQRPDDYAAVTNEKVWYRFA